MKTVEEKNRKNSDLEKATIELDLFKKKSEAEFQRDKKKWTNRRRMAYLSMGTIIMLTIYMFHFMDIPRIEVLKGVTEWIFTLFTSIVLSYLGMATYEDIKKG